MCVCVYIYIDGKCHPIVNMIIFIDSRSGIDSAYLSLSVFFFFFEFCVSNRTHDVIVDERMLTLTGHELHRHRRLHILFFMQWKVIPFSWGQLNRVC